MIKFEIQPSQSRCNLYYLASILIVERIISKLKPQSDFYFSFVLTEPIQYPPVLEQSNSGDITSFEKTIIKETNDAMMSIYTNTIKNPCDINEITERVKKSIKFHLKGKTPIQFPLNLESAIDLLTPFSIYENRIEHTQIGLTHKLTAIIMAIYTSSVDQQVALDVQALLEKEPSYQLRSVDHD